MRMYDPRVGRFFSADPLRTKYPHYTPYQFAGNKPVTYIDLDGCEEATTKHQTNGTGNEMGVDGKPIPASATDIDIYNGGTYATLSDGTQVLITIGTVQRYRDGNKLYAAQYDSDGNPMGYTAYKTLSTEEEMAAERVNAQSITPLNVGQIPANPEPGQIVEYVDEGIEGVIMQQNARDANAAHFNFSDAARKAGAQDIQYFCNIAVGGAVGGGVIAGTSALWIPFATEMAIMAIESEPLLSMGRGGVNPPLGYRAIHPEFAPSTSKNGFYKSGAPGRLGNDGIYANSTMEGAVSEFQYHNPGVTPAVYEVRCAFRTSLAIDPPSGYFSQPLPFTQGANILKAPSLRAPRTTNYLIREGAVPGNRVR